MRPVVWRPVNWGCAHQVWSSGEDILSGQVSVLLPGSGENVSNQPLGSGETAWEVRGLWGHHFGAGQFADLQLAHRWRGGEDLNECAPRPDLGMAARGSLAGPGPELFPSGASNRPAQSPTRVRTAQGSAIGWRGNGARRNIMSDWPRPPAGAQCDQRTNVFSFRSGGVSESRALSSARTASPYSSASAKVSPVSWAI